MSIRITTKYIKENFDIEKEKKYIKKTKQSHSLSLMDINNVIQEKTDGQKLSIDEFLDIFNSEVKKRIEGNTFCYIYEYPFDSELEIVFEKEIEVLETNTEVIERLKKEVREQRKKEMEIQKAKEILKKYGEL